jgi:hypothetical protein
MDIIDSVISKATALYDLAKMLGNTDLLREIGDLQVRLTDMQMAYCALRKENLDLSTKLQNLEDAIAGKLVFHKGAYYLKDSDEIFCVACFDGEHVLSHLVETAGGMLRTTPTCPRCKNRFILH